MPGATDTHSQSSYEWPSLTSDQQRLLLQALNSNDRRLNMNQFNDYQHQPLDDGLSTSMGVDPHVFGLTPPADSNRKAGRPVFGDGLMPHLSNGHTTDFDVELPQDLVDGLSGFDNIETGEKRKSTEDDDEQEESEAKRRESGDKGPKKPGRKPLMAEPTTKRKAQNRAAQRAFRERKEQHLKDLETKISDLTQVSQSANQENSVLRAQVARLQDEVKMYKKRLSSGGGIGSRSSLDGDFNLFPADGLGSSNNPFDFAFQTTTNFNQSNISPPSSHRKSTSSHSPINDVVDVKQEPTSRSNSQSWSPDSVLNGLPTPDSRSPSQADIFTRHNSTNTSNVFTPGLFDAQNNYGFPQFGSPSPLLAQQNGTSAANANGLSYSSVGSRGSSGSVSSHAPSPSLSSWRNGTSSSCGTSPEPWHEANNDKTSSAQNQTPNNSTLGGLSEFQFDPSLFGGYRESQDAIFGDGDFSGGLYDDFLNMPNTTNGSLEHNNTNQTTNMPLSSKNNLMDEVNRQREGVVEEEHIHIPEDSDKRQMMTCHKIWEQLRECPKFQQGDLDIDGLCSELSKKATCSESGANIPKDEWEAALWRMVGQPGGAKPEKKASSPAQQRNGSTTSKA